MTKAEIKRKQNDQLVAAMKAGYATVKTDMSPYLFSSDMDSAWRIGRWCRWVKACACPVSIKPSRGRTYRIRDSNSTVDIIVRVSNSCDENPVFINC